MPDVARTATEEDTGSSGNELERICSIVAWKGAKELQGGPLTIVTLYMALQLGVRTLLVGVTTLLISGSGAHLVPPKFLSTSQFTKLMKFDEIHLQLVGIRTWSIYTL